MRIDSAVATLPLPGQPQSGDLSLVKRIGSGTLVAVVDGLGHGQEAASSALAAVNALDRYAKESLLDLVKRCHTALSGMRGVVLGLAFFDLHDSTMTWLGVGNVSGILLRADQSTRPPRVGLVPVAGFIGGELPHPTTRTINLTRGDTLILTSDGIKDGFADGLALSGTTQAMADGILARHAKGNDDALVLVARYAA